MSKTYTRRIFCFGFLFFTKKIIRTFFADEKAQLVFVSTAAKAVKKGFNSSCIIAFWGKRGEYEAGLLADQFNVPVWQVEDGFLRSTGLGSDFEKPASLVIDKTGIYYDPSKPSDLECILQDYQFADAELRKAGIVRQMLLEKSISKYNLGISLELDSITALPGQKVILIPGQVEDDASIQKGCIDICTNVQLIKAVRSNEPEAFIIFKPHPDVVSGNRQGKVPDGVASNFCDLILKDTCITDCLAVSDEIHTITSLVGFEALVRDKIVVCYGLPFYAGWGLTVDRHFITRRTKKLSLIELIAATYIVYPLYIDWQTNRFVDAEFIIKKLHDSIHREGGKKTVRVGRLRRQIIKIVNISKGVLSDLLQ